MVDRGVRLVSTALALVVSDQTEKVGVKRKRIEKCLEQKWNMSFKNEQIMLQHIIKSNQQLNIFVDVAFLRLGPQRSHCKLVK